MNDADHPAAAGSTITVFATGMGETRPFVDPGSIATSSAVSPVAQIYANVESGGPPIPPLSASSFPGFVSSIFQIQIPDLQTTGGTSIGNGVSRVEVFLVLDVREFIDISPPASNFVSVYVK